MWVEEGERKCGGLKRRLNNLRATNRGVINITLSSFSKSLPLSVNNDGPLSKMWLFPVMNGL